MNKTDQTGQRIRMTNIHFLQFIEIFSKPLVALHGPKKAKELANAKVKELDRALSREDAAFLIEEHNGGKDEWSTLSADDIVSYARTGETKQAAPAA